MLLNFRILSLIKKLVFTILLLLLIMLAFAQQNITQTRTVKFICASCEGGGGSGGGGLPPITCTGQRDTVFVDGISGNNFSGSGRSWAGAVKTLQRGLAIASTCEEVKYIFVAKGTYTASTTSGTAAARDYSFAVGRSISIQGGFPTGGGTRNFVNNPTILDGEIQDLYEAYHVMVIYGTTATVSIDGFQFKNGFADGSGSVALGSVTMARNVGAALYIRDAANVNIKNCVFYTNVASNVGGAIYANNSNLRIENCVFVNNTSGNNAGAIYLNNLGTANITNCTLYNNLNLGGGDAIYNTSGTTLSMKNSLIWGNTVAFGGGGTRNVSYSLLPNGNINNNNLDTDPCFNSVNNLFGADGTWFTQDDGLNVSTSSPAVNRGSNDLSPNISQDITRMPRKFNDQIDIGAYEKQVLPSLPNVSLRSINLDSTDTYVYDGVTAFTVDQACRVIALIEPMAATSTRGRMQAKTYIDAGSTLAFEGMPLVSRHYHINDEQATVGPYNRLTFYFNNVEFNNYNLRSDVIAKLPTSSNLEDVVNLRVFKFKGPSATGTLASYNTTPELLDRSYYNLTWSAALLTWKLEVQSDGEMGGFFMSTAKDYVFTGNGNWSDASNWLNNEVPPIMLPKYYRIIIQAGAQCIVNVHQILLSGSKLEVEKGAVFIIATSITVEGDLILNENEYQFNNGGNFIVPIGVTNITVALYGAGGYGYSNAAAQNHLKGNGGYGGFVAGTLAVTPGEILTIVVPESTHPQENAGYSMIARADGTILMLAAGGGNGSVNLGNGGNAGASGADGTTGFYPGIPNGVIDVAKGGTLTAGGAGGQGATNGTNGSYLLGGLAAFNPFNDSGHGGNGYYGGGGSSGSDLQTHGGGGGGSNYISPFAISFTHNGHAGNIVPPHPILGAGSMSGYGAGGGILNPFGYQGYVIIWW